MSDYSDETGSSADFAMADIPETWKLGCVSRQFSKLLYYRWRFQAWLVEAPGVSIAVTGISAAFAYLYMMVCIPC